MRKTTTHMITSEFGVACVINLTNGDTHKVTTDFSTVDCTECREKWSEYIISELEEKLRRLNEAKEEVEEELRDTKLLNVSLEHENRRQRTRLRQASLDVGVKANTIHLLRQELEDLRRGAQGITYIPGFHV